MRQGMHLVAASVLLAALSFGEATGQPPDSPTAAGTKYPAVATVGGKSVHLEQIDSYIRDKLQITLLPNDQLRQLRLEVATDLVGDLLLEQHLTKEVGPVESAELDRQLAAFTRSLAARGKSLAEFLKETAQTESELRDSWRLILLLNRYVRKTVSEEQLKQYYRANKDYFDGIEVKASHILARFGPRQLPNQKQAALKSLEAIRAEIAAGRIDFATAARRHSQCPSAADGGDLGYIPRKGMFEEKLSAAVFALRPGELSPVIESDLGYHLVTVSDRKPGKESVFEKCIEDVRDTMAADLRVDLVKQLRVKTPVKITVP